MFFFAFRNSMMEYLSVFPSGRTRAPGVGWKRPNSKVVTPNGCAMSPGVLPFPSPVNRSPAVDRTAVSLSGRVYGAVPALTSTPQVSLVPLERARQRRSGSLWCWPPTLMWCGMSPGPSRATFLPCLGVTTRSAVAYSFPSILPFGSSSSPFITLNLCRRLLLGKCKVSCLSAKHLWPLQQD